MLVAWDEDHGGGLSKANKACQNRTGVGIRSQWPNDPYFRAQFPVTELHSIRGRLCVRCGLSGPVHALVNMQWLSMSFVEYGLMLSSISGLQSSVPSYMRLSFHWRALSVPRPPNSEGLVATGISICAFTAGSSYDKVTNFARSTAFSNTTLKYPEQLNINMPL